MSKHATIPKHCLHRRSGRGYVRLNGTFHYTGTWGSEEADEAYQRLLAVWLSNGRELPSDDLERPQMAYAVKDLVADYWEYAEQYYQRDGQPTKEVVNMRYALRPLLEQFGSLPAAEFGPLKLKAYRAGLIDKGYSRGLINQRVGVVKRMFRWGAGEEKVSGEIAQALRCLDGLRFGRTAARETAPVKPVTEASVRAVLPYLTRQVAAMVEVQWLTGMRPGEVVQMRTIDLDRTGPVWLYRPRRHKTQHHGLLRIIALGPKAQAILQPFLKLDPQAPLFSPKEAMHEHRTMLASRRKTKVQPSQVARRLRRQQEPREKLKDAFTTGTYAQAITRACVKAGVPHWSPNQIRHTVADRIRKSFGLDAARAVLGHTSTEVTEVYAEVDQKQAVAIMEQCG